MSRNHFVSGEHNFICDSCGKKLKSGQGRKRWDGFYVCQDDWEVRHPQDFVRARQDRISVPWTRPINDVFLTQNMSFFLDDTALLTDRITTANTFNRDMADSLAITDTFASTTGLGFLDNNTITDNFTKVYSAVRSVSDTATVSDSLILTSIIGYSVGSAALNTTTLG